MHSMLILVALLLHWLQVPGGDWQVGQDTLDSARTGLESRFLSEAAESEGAPKWSEYTFQYEGRIVDGRRLVYINAFCTDPPDTAATQWVNALDGGTCYFSAFYEPDTGKIVSFQFNGVA
jgi:hypothetical protein